MSKRLLLIGFGLLLGLYFSCKSKDPIIEKFHAFISSSSKVNIAFGNRLDTNQKIIDTTISDVAMVAALKDFIIQSGEKDTCYYLSGTITFLNASEDGFMIDFGLKPECPAY